MTALAESLSLMRAIANAFEKRARYSGCGQQKPSQHDQRPVPGRGGWHQGCGSADSIGEYEQAPATQSYEEQ